MKTPRFWPHAIHRARIWLAVGTCGLALLLLLTTGAGAATHNVQVGGPDGPFYNPPVLEVQPGDTVKWTWFGANHAHTVSSGKPPQGDGRFGTPEKIGPYTYSYTFKEAGRFDYFCVTHVAIGFDQTGVIYVGIPAPPPAAQPLNVSTRLRVQTGENAMIGGFMVRGKVPKRVIVRALGPSLAEAGVANTLADPTLTLHSFGNQLASNDDWKSSQQAEIDATGVAPGDGREAAIVATLQPGAYTAVVEGKDAATGVGLVEVYDLETGADSKLVNISTRGVVGTGSDVMIGGFILGKENGAAPVIVRAMGPSLAAAGVSGVLSDPMLELRDGNGELVRSNNNWKESQQAEVQDSGAPPGNDVESAIVATIPPGPYTAIVAGNGGATGVALVELYTLKQ